MCGGRGAGVDLGRGEGIILRFETKRGTNREADMGNIRKGGREEDEWRKRKSGKRNGG